MIIKNPYNIVVPAYLDGEFFTNALEEGLREVKINVSEINFEWGSNPGDNFCSCIYRVVVVFQRLNGDFNQKEQLSLIVKSIPIARETQFLEDVGVFIKEKIIYTDILPRLEILGLDFKFGANCYYTIKSPTQTIVFDDLQVDGFRLAARQDGLDWHHSVLLLQQLGRFHATSMVLAQKDPNIVKRLKNGMLCEDTIIKSNTYKHIFGSTLLQLISYVKNWQGYLNITERLAYYYDHFNQITLQTSAAKADDRYVVLNHGDLWITNFMFAYDNPTTPEKPTRSMFIDFQLSIYASPAMDINFFLNTSVQLEVLQKYRNDLIREYYKTFSETLARLLFQNIPTFEDLQHELRSRELYGLFGLYGFYPMINIPKEVSGDSSIEAWSDEAYKRKKFDNSFSSEKVQAFLKWNLKRMEALGVFNDF